MSKRNNRGIYYICGLGVLVVLAVCIAMCVTVIPTGHTGIKVHYGQIQQEKILPGEVIFASPFSDKIDFVNNKMQNVNFDNKIWGETNDATPVYIEGVQITFQIFEDASIWVYTNISDYKNNIIPETLVASALKSAMVELAPNEVTNRAKIEPLALQKVTEAINKQYGENVVSIKNLLIKQMDFEEAYNAAIQEKSLAAQRAAKAEIENKIAIDKAEADKKIAVATAEAQLEVEKKQAETNAEIAKISAEAEAEATRIKAEAEAEANRKISESLDKELLDLKRIEKWNGQMPDVITSDMSLMYGYTDQK